jgi:hypothetical protein
MAGMAKAIPITPTGKYGWHGAEVIPRCRVVRLVRRGEQADEAAGVVSPPAAIQIKDAAFALQSECSCTR